MRKDIFVLAFQNHDYQKMEFWISYLVSINFQIRIP